MKKSLLCFVTIKNYIFIIITTIFFKLLHVGNSKGYTLKWF